MIDMTEISCIKCGIEILDKSVIYIRVLVDDKWGSHACCTKCWYKNNPDRLPVRINLD